MTKDTHDIIKALASEAGPALSRTDVAAAAREILSELSGVQECATPTIEVEPGIVQACPCSICTRHDWFTSFAEAQETIERYKTALEVVAFKACEYGDGCPHRFGRRHHFCDPCRAREALGERTLRPSESIDDAREHHRRHGDMNGGICLLSQCAEHYPGERR